MRVIIVGGVAAGMSAAAKLKRMKPDYEVVIYEKTDVISFGACGLPYFVGGFFDDSREMIARTPEEFKKTGIELNIFHEVTAVNPSNKTITVKDIDNNKVFEDKYDELMIATGASCIIPPIENINLENEIIHTFNANAIEGFVNYNYKNGGIYGYYEGTLIYLNDYYYNIIVDDTIIQLTMFQPNEERLETLNQYLGKKVCGYAVMMFKQDTMYGTMVQISLLSIEGAK